MLERLFNQVGKHVGLALAELKQHPWLVFLLLFLGCALLAPYVVGVRRAGLHVNTVALYLALGMTLLAFVSRRLLFPLGLVLIPLDLIYLHLNRHWGGKQLNSRIEAAFESPPGEAFEYLRAHLDFIDWLTMILLGLYLALLIYAVFRNKQRLPGFQRIAGVALIAWVIVFVGGRVDRKLAGFGPIKLIGNALEAKDRYDLLSGRQAFLGQHPLPSSACSTQYDKVVVVLGESAISDHMSLFGYSKPTTPFARQSKPHAFDAMAPANQTRYSLAMMLTSASPGDIGAFYREHSLVGELRACGYETLWISNQGRYGMYDSFTTSIAMEADEQIFLNELSWVETKYDGQIVDELAARDIYSRHRHATFVHLIGSHVLYGERYPVGFGFSDVSGTVAQYDNSLLYTDHVLAELYKNFYDDSVLFIYVSDHGQYLSEEVFGSGFLPGYKEEYRIPLLVWTKDSAAIERIRAAVGHATLNADSLNSVVRYLVGRSPDPEVSTARKVSVLTPENVQVYDDLESFEGK